MEPLPDPIQVHGGGGLDDHEAWLEAAEATGTYPRTLDQAHRALTPLAPMWVAIMEPWPGSVGHDLTVHEQMDLLWQTGAPDGIDIHDTTNLSEDRRTTIERLIHRGRWDNLSDATGWDDGETGVGDFTMAYFGQLGDGLLASVIGVHATEGSVREPAPLHVPERIMVAAVDSDLHPFVVRLVPGTGCPTADRLKTRLLGETVIDQHRRLHGVTIIDVFDDPEDP